MVVVIRVNGPCFLLGLFGDEMGECVQRWLRPPPETARVPGSIIELALLGDKALRGFVVNKNIRTALALSAGITLAVVSGCATHQSSPQPLRFSRDVLPILSDKCFHCHGPDNRNRKAGLRLDQPESVLSVLGSGLPEDSELFFRITTNDLSKQMPHKDATKKLSQTERDFLVRWVREGALYQKHWAFIPPQRPALPEVSKPAWPENGIDYFILKRLEDEGLRPSPRADRATLLRRVSLCLTGLPPTPSESEAFQNDASPDAYEKVVDQLLASPRYGEHMALTWLETARYADTDGFQNDRLRYMHVWRDWVIEAMNLNLPFDDFVIDQLAGDMRPDATLRQQIATGFNRNHRINSEAGSIPEEWHAGIVMDRVDTLGTVFMGLTTGCVRCHDHKYDPVTQKEYYGLYAIFNNVPEWGLGPNNGNSPPLIPVPKNWPNLLPEEDRLIIPEPMELKTSQGVTVRPLPGDNKTVMVMQEMPEPRPTYLLRRGQYDAPDTDEVIPAGVPQVLLQKGAAAPSNRLELAHWLVDTSNPLTARVIVNRYWQHFLGIGIVKTAENLGIQGEYPTHPELLDWLATEFIRLEWDVKAMHKLIAMSATYRQSSALPSGIIERDPDNRLLARGPRVRLTGQQLRDQALFVSGLLVERLGGPSVKPYMPPGLWESMTNAVYHQGKGKDLYRRSLYTYWRRTTPPPSMMTFNAGDRDICTVRTEKTNTPLQALTLMNNVVFVESARFLAERMIGTSAELDEQLVNGFLRVTARQPAPEELADLRRAFHVFKRQFQSDPAGAEALLSVGEKLRNPTLRHVNLAGMTMVASAILNLDEAIVNN
jgi:hypothetical protein